jgi:uncharacterized protein YbjT (DUF2867 family)
VGRHGLIAVTGATGGMGGRVARRLAGRGVEQRLVVRDTSRAPELSGAEAVQASGYDARAEMEAAFGGVQTVFLVSATETEGRVEIHGTAIDAAVAAGVERLVYLSFCGAAADSVFTFARDHFHTEQLVRASELDFSLSRQNFYLDVVPGFAGPDGVIRGPAGDGRFAPVARDDAADVIVELLTDTGRDGAGYDLTGPEALSLAEIAAKLTEVSGREVRYEEETVEEAWASRRPTGAPDWEIEGWVSTYLAIAAGEVGKVTDTVREVAGHPPQGLDEFLAEHPGSYSQLS